MDINRKAGFYNDMQVSHYLIQVAAAVAAASRASAIAAVSDKLHSMRQPAMRQLIRPL